MRLRSNTTRLPGWHRALALFVTGCFGAVTMADRSVPRASAQAGPAGIGATVPSNSAVARTGEDRLTQPQLEQLLAPVALYPDALLAQLLMAATYPLELVQAQRWLERKGNASLQGEALAQALQSQPWDASVKSLVPFPDVLKMMNEQLEWTQQVGDAVLAQQADVLNAVQVLRNRAQQAGQLQSGPQQTITVVQNVPAPVQATAPSLDGGAPSGAVLTTAAAAPAVEPPPQIITIEPTQPDQVHVPAYNPSVVYGSWPYPSYPPPYYPPPVGYGVGSALLTGMAFAGGVALVGSIWGGAGFGWGSGDINVNTNRTTNIDRSRTTGDVGNRWQHNTAHRQGVAYRGDEVRNRYQGNRPDRSASRDQFRGRVQQADRAGDAFGGADRGGVGDRGGIGDRAASVTGAGSATAAGRRPGRDRGGRARGPPRRRPGRPFRRRRAGHRRGATGGGHRRPGLPRGRRRPGGRPSGRGEKLPRHRPGRRCAGRFATRPGQPPDTADGVRLGRRRRAAPGGGRTASAGGFGGGGGGGGHSAGGFGGGGRGGGGGGGGAGERHADADLRCGPGPRSRRRAGPGAEPGRAGHGRGPKRDPRSGAAPAEPVPPQAFRSPEDGFAAMADAARAHDERRLLRILGEAARRLIRSGDPVADRAARERFAAAYAEKAEILWPAPYLAVLQVGNDGWPLPIPMVRHDDRWRFDARQGAQELADRRIGRNELDTVEVLHAIVDAQDEYARTAGRQGAFQSYARRFFSTPGTRNGLYWPAAEGEPESPLGPLVAAASAGGYRRPAGRTARRGRSTATSSASWRRRVPPPRVAPWTMSWADR